jgi:hypothetical protein
LIETANTCEVHKESDESGGPGESHYDRQSEKQEKVCTSGGLVYHLGLGPADEEGAPAEEHDVEGHEDKEWSHDGDKQRGYVAEPTVVQTVTWPKAGVQVGELDEEGRCDDEGGNGPAAQGVRSEPLPVAACHRTIL